MIPGRAMLIEIETHEEQEDEPRRLRTHKPGVVRLLGVYAPNAPAENALFWKTLREFFEQNPHLKPDIFGGDMKQSIGYRATKTRKRRSWNFPTTRDYTFTQFRRDQTGSQSRIDRLHITREIFDQSYKVGSNPACV
ncbi:hypothetical protein R3P38DRAFT_2836466 [Favolaschia claudopus]|uniref:Uncharacterized protein n=1 Tax=Favolaschia claudopus TaxID=2862362 RepID=A0AAW0E8D6_9AGAR